MQKKSQPHKSAKASKSPKAKPRKHPKAKRAKPSQTRQAKKAQAPHKTPATRKSHTPPSQAKQARKPSTKQPATARKDTAEKATSKTTADPTANNATTSPSKATAAKTTASKTIAIIGRPNVGKSSLFNRLAKRRLAITSDIAGTTRDTRYTQILLESPETAQNPAQILATIIDTGGIGEAAELRDELSSQIAQKALESTQTADLILYLVDGKQPPSDEDRKLFFSLHRLAPTLLVLNKIDNDAQREHSYSFASFGVGEPYCISVSHNRGISILLRAIARALQDSQVPAPESHIAGGEEELLAALSHTAQIAQTHRAQKEQTHTQETQTQQTQTAQTTQNNAQANNSAQTSPQATKTPQKDPKPPENRNQNPNTSQNLSQKSPPPQTSPAIIPLEKPLESIASAGDSLDSLDSLDSRPCEQVIQVGIIGRVNVGKSSLLNALVGQERSLVSPRAGTTMDPVNEEIAFEQATLRFIDTAGIRRKGQIHSLEKFALERTRAVLEQAHIAILVLDASAPLVELDEKLFSLVQHYALGIIIVWNKWDIAYAPYHTIRADFLRRFRFLEYAPFLTLSALTGRHITELKRKILEIYANYSFRIPTAKLNATLAAATKSHPIPSDRGKLVRIYYATQYATKPPQIALICNRPKSLHFSYKRFLINWLRKEFSLSGTPILLSPRDRSQDKPS